MLSKRIYLFNNQHLSQLVYAVCIYLYVSICLYGPYLRNFSHIEFLFVINSTAGSIGCFLLSRRWTKTFTASLLAGAVYAFGPFSLAFSAYHPFAGVPAAMLPWLFIPVTIFRPQKRFTVFSAALNVAFYAFPFVIILAFFLLLSLPSIGPFFPMPVIKANLVNLSPIVFPLTGNAQDFTISFYHLPFLSLLMGILLYVSSRNIALIILSAVGLCLSFCEPVFETPPIVWTLMLVTSCSILAAMGSEILTQSKKTTVKWILPLFLVSSVLAVFSYLTGQTYCGTIYAGASFLLAATAMIPQKSRNRQFVISIIFYTACFADIISGAKYTLEQIFGFGF